MSSDLKTASPYSTPLVIRLSEIETAHLISPLDENDLSYLFKHALVQDTAYRSLMRHDRKRLHHLVGQVLEKVYPDRLDELAPRLAAHFDEAGDTAQALLYYHRAARDAAARYANREALDFYAHALDAAQELESDLRDSLHRERALVYERIGNFEAARVDLERALEIARATGDEQAEWQSLIDLGFAWLARDYAHAGDYFENALELARESNDIERVAYTLNRVGNWYLNNEDPQRALEYHHEALGMFEHLNDLHGLAETEDLLGMTNLVGSNLVAAREHFSRALDLFNILHDSRGYVNSLMSNYLYGASMQGDTVVLPPPPGDKEQGLTEILRLTRQVGWRAGEAYGLWIMGEGFAAVGEYGRAFELLEQSLVIAHEIDHRQWLAAATMVLGAVHDDILDHEGAQERLETALSLAQEIGSTHWMRTTSGLLASTYLALNLPERAEEILDKALPPGSAARTLGQRQSWAARMELALARRDPETALQWHDLLLRDASNVKPETVIPHLWTLRAQALLQQGNAREAVDLIRAAHREAHNIGQTPLSWRCLTVLAQAHRSLGQMDEAERAVNDGLGIVKTLANTVPDPTLRARFVERATARIREA